MPHANLSDPLRTYDGALADTYRGFTACGCRTARPDDGLRIFCGIRVPVFYGSFSAVRGAHRQQFVPHRVKLNFVKCVS